VTSHEPIPISLEEKLVHTDDFPFCFDDTCLCHEDQTLIQPVAQAVEDGLLTPEEATLFISGKTL